MNGGTRSGHIEHDDEKKAANRSPAGPLTGTPLTVTAENAVGDSPAARPITGTSGTLSLVIISVCSRSLRITPRVSSRSMRHRAPTTATAATSTGTVCSPFGSALQEDVVSTLPVAYSSFSVLGSVTPVQAVDRQNDGGLPADCRLASFASPARGEPLARPGPRSARA